MDEDRAVTILDMTTGWRKGNLGALVDLRLSGVDKKTKHNERVVRLYNYTDVYNNSFIIADMDSMPKPAPKDNRMWSLLSLCVSSSFNSTIQATSAVCGRTL